jgi:osmotically-inducible protein OsmY
LRADEKTVAVDVSIEVDAGTVVLAGIVATTGERDRAAEVVASVPGVVRVDNLLNSMSGGLGRRMFPSGLTQ